MKKENEAPPHHPEATTGETARHEIFETPRCFLLSVDIPGVSAESLQVEIRTDELVIGGTRRASTASAPCHFEQRFPVPRGIDETGVLAHCRDGVLEVAFPKRTASAWRRVPVSTGAESPFDRLLGEESAGPPDAGPGCLDSAVITPELELGARRRGEAA
jgi:HSP20 family protein